MGIRSDPVASRQFRILCLIVAFWAVRVDWGHGGGRRVGPKNEGRRERLTREWRILVVKSEILRSVGIRSDPLASRRFRILCLFGKFGRFASIGVIEAGGGLGPQMKDVFQY